MNSINNEYFKNLINIFDLNKGVESFHNCNLHIDNSDNDLKLDFENIDSIIKKYKFNLISENIYTDFRNMIQLYIHYSTFNELSNELFEQYLISFYISSNKNPLKALVNLLNSNLYSIDLINLSYVLNKNKFSKILYNLLHENYNVVTMYINENDSFFSTFSSEIKNIIITKFNNKKITNEQEMKEYLKKITTDFKILNLSETPEYEVKNDNYKFQNKQNYNIEINLLETIFGKDNNEALNEINNILDEYSIENILNPDNIFIKKIKDKYSNYLASIKDSPNKCRIIKTILFIAAYLDKNNENYYPSKRMKNIVNTDIRWATGTEETSDPSFYGDSEIAKAFSVYYSFMNGNRNPYYQVINNNLYDYMDEESLKMHKYFRENINSNLLYEIFYNKKIIGNKSISEILSTFSEIIEILESPIIGSNKNMLSEIIGIVTSILNSVAQILDFSLSNTVRSFFYIKFIPIGNNKYSISDIYNYLIFLKLILECSNGNVIISEVSREEIVAYAYKTLGIRTQDIKKIAYCSYDYEMNDKSGLNLYSEYLFKNNYGEQFTLRSDMKIIYSLIQFGLMKQVYNTGNYEIYNNFDFSDLVSIRKIINSLTSVEKYYVFKIHSIDFIKMSEINLYSLDDIYEFEKEIKKIYNSYDCSDISFYKSFIEFEDFLKNNNTSFKDEAYYNFFITNINYNAYINTCLKEYNNIVQKNKYYIDQLIFEINGISNIDDFIMRFLPSILEVLKLLNIETDSINSLIKFLDFLCYFISDLLFRNLFIKIKFELSDQIKQFEKNMFSIFEENNYIFKLNIGGININNKIKEILDNIDSLILNSSNMKDCFVDISQTINNYDYYQYTDSDTQNFGNLIEVDVDGNIISSNPIKYPSQNESLDLKDVYDNIKDKNNNKLIYSNGSIYIEDSNGNRIKVVYENDNYSPSNKTFTNVSDNNSKTLNDEEISGPIIDSENEYETLIQIRDFIFNINNSTIVNIVNELTKIKNDISKEQSKRLPNNTIIKELNEKYSELTKELQYAKNKNNVYVSELSMSSLGTSNNEITGSDYQGDIIISDNYNGLETAILKKELLEEVETVVMKNNIPLTNYEIIQLLK